jgi:hypothetical protein
MQKQQLCFGGTALFQAATVNVGNDRPASMKTPGFGRVAVF